MTECTVVLDPIVTSEGFVEGADAAGWERIAERHESESSNHELIYRPDADDKKNTIHYVEDQFVRVRYVLVRGPDARALAEAIRERYDYIDEGTLLELAETDSDDLQTIVDGLMSVTVLGDQVGHARLARLVEKRLAHENKAVRRAALIAVSWLEWPDFRATVERLARHDPAKDAREDAVNLAESYALRDTETAAAIKTATRKTPGRSTKKPAARAPARK